MSDINLFVYFSPSLLRKSKPNKVNLATTSVTCNIGNIIFKKQIDFNVHKRIHSLYLNKLTI